MSLMFRDRKETEFDYGSTFCPYKDGCEAHNCFNCRVIERKSVISKKDCDLENHYVGGL